MSEIASPLLKSTSPPDNAETFSPLKQPSSPMLKSKPTLTDLNLKPTFVTGTNAGGKRGYDEKPRLEEVYNYYEKINGVIDHLGSTVKSLLNDNQSTFLIAYKEQMVHIQKELNILRRKIDEETYKRKNDERMNILEQERDWFRAEAIRLDKICKEQHKSIEDLKFKIRNLSDDKSYFEQFVLAAKKENKALKDELLQMELGKAGLEDFPQIQPLHSKSGPTTLKKKYSFDFSSNSRHRTPVRNINFQANELILKREEAIRNDYINLKETLNHQMAYSNEDKLLEVIKQMKIELEKERKVIRQLKTDKAQYISRRIELEQILVECINEVKKEISRRRNTQSYKDLSKGPQVPIDIDITKFSATDKRTLLEFFLSQDAVLDEVYNLVFNNHQPAQNLPTPTDQPQNHALSSTKSESKLRYSFNYGFGSASNLRVGAKDINNAHGAVSQKAQVLIGELKKQHEIKKIDPLKREL